jgi:hypothetical protein
VTKGAPQDYRSDFDQLSRQQIADFAGVLSPSPYQRLLMEAMDALCPERFGGAGTSFECRILVEDGALFLSITPHRG